MNTATFLIWAPNIFYLCMFILIGIISLKRKSIPIKIVWWLFAVYLIERIIEIILRTYLTKISIAQMDPNSFTYIRMQALIGPSLKAIVEKQIVGIVIASAVGALLIWYAKKTEYQKIDHTDALLFSFGTLIAGWPNFLIYIGVVFILAALGLTIQTLFFRRTGQSSKNSHHMIVTPYFAIAGIIVIFWGWELSKLVGLYALR